MKIQTFTQTLQQLEQTTSRNQMTVILAKLLSKSKAQEIGQICYMLLGRVVASFEDLDFGIADKIMIQVIMRTANVNESTVKKNLQTLGDFGEVAQKLHKSNKRSELSVKQAHSELIHIAKLAGKGSQEEKITRLAGLMEKLDQQSVKYIVRILLGKLRLGFSDMTLLDALSWMSTGDKTLRKPIESAYNKCSDIGYVAEIFKKEGLSGLKQFKIIPGKPIRVAKAERLPDIKSILKKMNPCAIEPKYDGFRVQIHRKDNQVWIYSRGLENMTLMFPELVKSALGVKRNSFILDGESIGYNPETDEFLPFQETVQRKRKYDISQKTQEIPLKVFVFDLLYIDGQSYLEKPFTKRREKLVELLKTNTILEPSPQIIVNTEVKFQSEYDLRVSEGLEGVIAKKLEAPYKAGGRDFRWVKYKRAREGGLKDSIDGLVLGYYYGQGKRQQFGIGAFLTGVIKSDKKSYSTIAKVGTGLTDIEWKQLKEECDKMAQKVKPSSYIVDKALNCDVWVEPSIVVELQAEEITRSPVHTACKKQDQSGYALRFPRLVKFRSKKPDEVTSEKEVLTLYQLQRK